MRILLVNDYGTVTGGAETGLLSLREMLRQRGHQVRFSPVPPGPAVTQWLAAHTGLGAVILTELPEIDYLTSGRSTVPLGDYV